MSSIGYLHDQKVYFVCYGTSVNKIIQSLPETTNKKTSFFTSLFKKKSDNNIEEIKEEEFSILDKIGIKEAYMCQENENNKTLFDKFNEVYTSLDFNAIETSLLLFDSSKKMKILPLPYMSKETNIKNNKKFNEFKLEFGKYTNIKNNKSTNSTNYWKVKKIENDFIDKKKISATIEWNKINTKDSSSLSSFNFQKFKSEFQNLILNKYVYTSIYDPIDDLIFVCNPSLIAEFLKMFKKVRFDVKKDVIENTSIWEINLNIEFHIDNRGYFVKDKSKIIYDSYQKYYPTKYNHEPLKLLNNNYSYTYDDYKYILFNSLQKIPLKYIKTLNLDYINTAKKNLIKKIINKNENKNKAKTNNNKNMRNSTKLTIESLS